MKKKILIRIVILLLAVFGLGTLTACNHGELRTVSNISEAVTYYGCPNSKRVKALNLKKKKL